MTRRSAPVVTHLPEIGVTAISRWLFTCYLVHGDGGAAPFAVDLGLPSQVSYVAGELRRRGGSLDELGAVVATHGHVDHVGGLPELWRRAPTDVLLPETLGEMLDGARPLRSPGPREIARILPVLADQPRDLGALAELRPLLGRIGFDGRAAAMPVPAAGWLRDGDRLPGHPDWEVVAGPGHTDDSTCLYHAPTRTLLSGDAVLSVGGRAWFTPELVDREAARATEARVRHLDVEHLLPGHGRVVTGPDLMGRALGPEDRPPRSSALACLGRVVSDHARRHPV